MLVKNGYLVFKPKDPIAFHSVMPHAKNLSVRGTEFLALKHTLDVVQVLRNMGVNAPSPVNYGWEYPGRYDPYPHQKDTVDFLTVYRRCFVLNEMGCVDANTEYLSPTGWKKISEYEGGKVAQYDTASGVSTFIQPIEYVKRPCEEMIRFKTTRGVDQLLSNEHRVVYISSTNKVMVKPAHEIEKAYHESERGWSGRFITAFNTEGGSGISDSDAELRLMVAIIADGYFGNSSNWCVVRIKKSRKKQRLRYLLKKAHVHFTETIPEYPYAKGFSVFRFYAPVKEKEFGVRYWDASREQLFTIADEVWRWDGSERKAGAVCFYSTSKVSADFIQYCFSATGKTATLRVSQQENWKPLYTVHAQADHKLRYLKGTSTEGTKKENVWREPSPDGFKYCFEVPTNALVLRRNGCVFITGNTMKTCSAIWAAEYLMQQGIVDRVLVVAPRSCLHKVWSDEIFQTTMHRPVAVLQGSREKRRSLVQSSAEYLVINHDGVGIVADLVHKDKSINLIIVDECAAYRNGQTEKYKHLKSCLRPDMRLWMMSGAPCPNAPTDAWAQARLVKPELVPPYFTTFKRATMTQLSVYKWIPKHDSSVTVHNAMQPAIRFAKRDCISLPPVTYQNRECQLTAEQKKMFKEMRKDLHTQHQDGPITAANAAVKLTKLIQICAGVVYDNHGVERVIESTPRLEDLMEIISECEQKVIVWVPFKSVLRHVVKKVNEKFNKDNIFADGVSGDTSDSKRRDIFSNFQDENSNTKVLVAHPGTAAHGLTLVSASTSIWYAPFFSPELYVQANERINRPGQRNEMSVIHMASTALEWGYYDSLLNSNKRQEIILDLYKNLVVETG